MALERSPSLDPRTWAAREISAEANVVRLNALLRDRFTERGAHWTRDIVPFHSRALYFYYLDNAGEDSLASETERLGRTFDITFGPKPNLVSAPAA